MPITPKTGSLFHAETHLTTNVMNYAANKPALHSLGMADVVAAYLKEACRGH